MAANAEKGDDATGGVWDEALVYFQDAGGRDLDSMTTIADGEDTTDSGRAALKAASKAATQIGDDLFR